MSLKKVTVAVGTSNELKVRAVKKVFRRYFSAKVIGVEVKTSISPQPVGVRELIKGAMERAFYAMRSVERAQFGVGIEAGLLEFYSSTGYLETQVALILGSNNRVSIGLSPSFELPPQTVKEMLEGKELSVASKIYRGNRDLGEVVGYIGVKTWGAMTRQDLTEFAVRAAIVPWLERSEWLITLENLASQLGLKEEFTER